MGCFGLFDGCNEKINDAKAVDDVIIKIDGADPSSDISGWEQRIEKNGNLSEGNLSEGKLSFGAGICLRLCVVIFLVVVWMVYHSQEFAGCGNEGQGAGICGKSRLVYGE
eukprot:773101_1